MGHYVVKQRKDIKRNIANETQKHMQSAEFESNRLSRLMGANARSEGVDDGALCG